MAFEISNKMRSYKTTKKTIYSCQYHVIWCTKYRRKVLDDSIQHSLVDLLNKKQDDYRYTLLEIETMPDSVHILIEIPPTDSVDTIIGKNQNN
jgi:putative transposase